MRGDRDAEPQLDVVLGVPLGRVDERLLARVLALQVALGQRRPLVRQLGPRRRPARPGRRSPRRAASRRPSRRPARRRRSRTSVHDVPCHAMSSRPAQAGMPGRRRQVGRAQATWSMTTRSRAASSGAASHSPARRPGRAPPGRASASSVDQLGEQLALPGLHGASTPGRLITYRSGDGLEQRALGPTPARYDQIGRVAPQRAVAGARPGRVDGGAANRPMSSLVGPLQRRPGRRGCRRSRPGRAAPAGRAARRARRPGRRRARPE